MESEPVELPSTILVARPLILTGCRLGEIITLKWGYLDFSEGALRMPDSKTGKKIVHLGSPAAEYLQDSQSTLMAILGSILVASPHALKPRWPDRAKAT
jgi:integrase